MQALVAQEPVLFNTSVRQNLLYGLPQCRIDSDPKDPETCATGIRGPSTFNHRRSMGRSNFLRCMNSLPCPPPSGQVRLVALQDFEEQMIAAAKAACAHAPWLRQVL